MNDDPLSGLSSYSAFMVALLHRPMVERSTVTIWPNSRYLATAEGEVFFSNGCRLRMREELDFEDKRIISYGYEVTREEEQLYWYDRFPHPEDPNLASTFPHHKHVPPDIRHNRIPAPKLSFIHPNLPFIIQEIESLP